MIIRRTEEKDIDSIMCIIRQAQEYMRSQGINQWQNGYPNKEVFASDIADGISYVAEDGENIIGTFAFGIMEEPTYKRVYEGQWKLSGEYGVIHRVAVDNNIKGNGLGGKIVEYVRQRCAEQDIKSIRIDTHRDNISMQRMLSKNGFERIGIIHLADGAERIAFEKELK